MARPLTTRQARQMANSRETHTGGRNGGRPAKGPRCPCGAMSAKRAKRRAHHC